MNKKCRRCKEVKPTTSFQKMAIGKYGVASTCFDCGKRQSWKKSDNQKAKEGKIQRTIPSEKLKAFLRDKGCIIPLCPVRAYEKLDFHHIHHHNSERIYDETRNLHFRGVMLCRDHHRKLTDGDKKLDTHCHEYIKKFL